MMRQVVGERKVRCHKRAVEILRGAEARETRGVGSMTAHPSKAATDGGSLGRRGADTNQGRPSPPRRISEPASTYPLLSESNSCDTLGPLNRISGVSPMLSRLLNAIRQHPSDALAVTVGLGILIFAFIDPQWWGKASLGLLIGIASTVVALLILMVLESNTTIDTDPLVVWTLVLVPTGVALVLRKVWKQDNFHPWTVNISLSEIPSPKTILLLIAGLLLLILIGALIRSLTRGESVSIDSHWGGLGGGIAGWRLSAPLVYLLGIAFLLTVSSALAWREFTAPVPNASPGQQSALPANSTVSPGSRADASVK